MSYMSKHGVRYGSSMEIVTTIQIGQVSLTYFHGVLVRVTDWQSDAFSSDPTINMSLVFPDISIEPRLNRHDLEMREMLVLQRETARVITQDIDLILSR
jgi:hypothetical protein